MATLGYQIANPAAPSNVLMSPWPHGEQLFADFLSDASASRHLWACEYAVRAMPHQRGVQKYR
jgi:lambda repressor-like predicted transcriptional regulator